jgi:hypothetical protein
MKYLTFLTIFILMDSGLTDFNPDSNSSGLKFLDNNANDNHKQRIIAQLRLNVKSYKFNAKDVIPFLKEQTDQLILLNLSKFLSDRNDLIPICAKDFMKIDPDLSLEEATEIATTQIIGNQCFAFTSMDDVFYGIMDSKPSDEKHEYLHILTAVGGRSDVMNFNVQLNEGCINYWIVAIYSYYKRDIYTRYPDETKLVKLFVEFIGDEGEELLYNLTFKNKINEFMQAIGDKYVDLPSNPNGKPKQQSEKTFKKGGIDVVGSAAYELSKKVENWSIKWFFDRFDK